MPSLKATVPIDPPTLPLATEILEEMLQTPNAAPAVEDHLEEIVSSQWRTYDMADQVWGQCYVDSRREDGGTQNLP